MVATIPAPFRFNVNLPLYQKKGGEKRMQKVIVAGVGAAVIAYLSGAVLGTYGAWSLLLDQATTVLGRWLIAMVIGVALAEAYQFFNFAKTLPGDTLVNGAIFGLFIWLITLVAGIVFVNVGQYVFVSPTSTNLFLQVLLHIVWGSTLAYLIQTDVK